jgi:hypothetical protein
MRLLISRVWFWGEIMVVVVGDIFLTDAGCWRIMTLREIEFARRRAAAACVDLKRCTWVE